MYYYILPTNRDIQHHGVLGMKWGVRRYQPYSVVPRGSGKGGKEIGDAAKYNKKVAKGNIKLAYKNIKDHAYGYEVVNKKIDKLNKKGKTEKAKAYAEKTKDIQKERKKILNQAIKEINKADVQLGEKEITKMLKNQAVKDLALGSISATIAYNAGLTVMNAVGIPTVWAPPFMVVPDFEANAATKYINENRKEKPLSGSFIKKPTRKQKQDAEKERQKRIQEEEDEFAKNYIKYMNSEINSMSTKIPKNVKEHISKQNYDMEATMYEYQRYLEDPEKWKKNPNRYS